MILIVDDKPENIFSLKTILELHSFPTDTALSGEEALKKILRKSYALIILDVQMPGMDGFEVCRRLRARPTLNHIRIVAVTGFPSSENVDRILAAGADACLEKPVDSERLLTELGLMAEKGVD